MFSQFRHQFGCFYKIGNYWLSKAEKGGWKWNENNVACGSNINFFDAFHAQWVLSGKGCLYKNCWENIVHHSMALTVQRYFEKTNNFFNLCKNLCLKNVRLVDSQVAKVSHLKILFTTIYDK